MCKYGEAQSPISIDPEEAVENADMSLEMNYHNETEIETRVRYNGNEIEAVGDFGELKFNFDY